MACVEAAIPVPDSRKKVDELFLYWLSEASTQDMLRKELAKVRGMPVDEHDIDYLDLSIPSGSLTSTMRPSSPNLRAPSPPPHSLTRSPKSPRGKQVRSPRKTNKSPKQQEHTLCKGARSQVKAHEDFVEEVDTDNPLHMFSCKTLLTVDSENDSNFINLSKEKGNLEVKHRDTLRAGRSHSPKPADLPKSPKVNVHLPTIPQFYFPNGKPAAGENVEQELAGVKYLFQDDPDGELAKDKFSTITKCLNLPLYWKLPLFWASMGKSKDRTTVNFQMFQKMWQRVTSQCHDEASRFVGLLATNGQNYLTEQDFAPLIQDIVETHPGLHFLETAPEFHERYVETVIGRIFYAVDRNWNGRISPSELRKSNFLLVLASLEHETDINRVTEYFSYEHFYVIYCKFWELDMDHDLMISAQDLARHADHALTMRIIGRIMSGVVTRNRMSAAQRQNERDIEPMMDYKDFVWFLLAEEDKTSVRSIEYWFRCLDVDGDGVLSLFELIFFYEEVLQHLQELNIDCLSIENTVCQILDMVNPREKGKITLLDLKHCKLTPVFFNTFVNVEKYLEHEQRDPVAAAKEMDVGEETGPGGEWDRYAAEQYDLLVQEESYDQDDFEEGDESEMEEDEKEMLELMR